MKSRLQKLLYKTDPFVLDITLYIVVLLVSNYAWKFTVIGDESDDVVTWFGWNISAPFVYMTNLVADSVFWIVSHLRDTVHLYEHNVIRFDNGTGTRIVWACSGLKQMFIWTCLIITSLGAWQHKLWYIPVGWVLCHLFNVFRIACIALLIENHPTWFSLLHDYIFKYAFYAAIFGMWVVFVMCFRSKHVRPLIEPKQSPAL